MSAIIDKSPWFQAPFNNFNNNQHVIIIGAGLAGCSAAAALARRGFHITIVDQHHQHAREASGNRTAVCMPFLDLNNSPARRWCNAGFQFTTTLLQQLQLSSWHSCGVFVSGDDQGQIRLKRLAAQQSLPDIRWYDGADIQTVCGIPLTVSGLFLTTAGFLNPAEFCRALLKKYKAKIKLVANQWVQNLSHNRDMWSIFDHNAKLLAQGPVVIIANGANATQFCQFCDLPLQINRGQLSEIRAIEQSSALRCVISTTRSVTPNYQGYHSVGASYSRNNLSKTLCQRDHEDNLAQLAAVCPDLIAALATQPYHSRVAFRTSSPDHLPIVGAMPNLAHYHELYKDLHHGRPASRYPAASYHPGLFISATHGSRGLVSAPLAGELIAKLINNEPLGALGQHLATVHPARFLIRQLQRGLNTIKRHL